MCVVVCVSVCMYLGMYVCVCLYMSECLSVRTVRECLCLCVCVFVYMCVRAFMSLHTFVQQ